MLRCTEMPRHRIVDLGKARIRAGHGLTRRDKVHKFAVHGLGRPAQGCERYRASFLRIFELGIGLPFHRGLLGHLSLGQSDRFTHGAEPAARRDDRCGSCSVQNLGLVLKAAEDDRSDFVCNVVFRLS